MCITLLITYLGIVIILTNKIFDYEILLLFVIPILYCICLASSSNVGLRSLSNALIISSMGTMILLGNDIKIFSKSIIYFVILYSLILKIFALYNNTIIDKNYVVVSGPFMYLQEYQGYSEEQLFHINEFSKYHDILSGERLIVINHMNNDYLLNDVRIGINIACLQPNYKNEYFEILDKYISIHNYNKVYVLLGINKLDIVVDDFSSYNVNVLGNVGDCLLFEISR